VFEERCCSVVVVNCFFLVIFARSIRRACCDSFPLIGDSYKFGVGWVQCWFDLALIE
jgi:hypothetical protein